VPLWSGSFFLIFCLFLFLPAQKGLRVPFVLSIPHFLVTVSTPGRFFRVVWITNTSPTLWVFFFGPSPPQDICWPLPQTLRWSRPHFRRPVSLFPVVPRTFLFEKSLPFCPPGVSPRTPHAFRKNALVVSERPPLRNPLRGCIRAPESEFPPLALFFFFPPFPWASNAFVPVYFFRIESICNSLRL